MGSLGPPHLTLPYFVSFFGGGFGCRAYGETRKAIFLQFTGFRVFFSTTAPFFRCFLFLHSARSSVSSSSSSFFVPCNMLFSLFPFFFLVLPPFSFSICLSSFGFLLSCFLFFNLLLSKSLPQTISIFLAFLSFCLLFLSLFLVFVAIQETFLVQVRGCNRTCFIPGSHKCEKLVFFDVLALLPFLSVFL